MALSDQLHTLAGRAKKAEDNVTTARTKAKAQLEADVQAAHESAKRHADALRAKADEGKENISKGWHDAQRSFHDKVATAKLKVDVRKAERDVKRAEKDIQKFTDEHIKQIDQLIAAKEAEIMEV